MPYSSHYCRFPCCPVNVEVEHEEGIDGMREAYIKLVEHELTHICAYCGYVPPHGLYAPPFWQSMQEHTCIAQGPQY